MYDIYFVSPGLGYYVIRINFWRATTKKTYLQYEILREDAINLI